MTKVSLTIDGKLISTQAGKKLLWTAMENDIYIPNLCAIREKPEPEGACRLCFVEIEGRKEPVNYRVDLTPLIHLTHLIHYFILLQDPYMKMKNFDLRRKNVGNIFIIY